MTNLTSPRGGEVGSCNDPGEGVQILIKVRTPHPKPLPHGERERITFDARWMERLASLQFDAEGLAFDAHVARPHGIERADHASVPAE